MPEFGYDTYPRFRITWDAHALGAVLYRLRYARGPEHRRLVWCAAWLASEAGYEVQAADWSIDIRLPNGLVIFTTDADSPFTADEMEVLREFAEFQLVDLPKPDPEAMRYGAAAYPPQSST